MENRITIKFIHGYRPNIKGDIATVSKEEATRLIRYGYAEIYVTDLEKEAAALEQIADPEALKTEPENTGSAQDEAKTEPVIEIEAQAISEAPQDKSIHGPRKKISKK